MWPLTRPSTVDPVTSGEDIGRRHRNLGSSKLKDQQYEEMLIQVISVIRLQQFTSKYLIVLLKICLRNTPGIRPRRRQRILAKCDGTSFVQQFQPSRNQHHQIDTMTSLKDMRRVDLGKAYLFSHSPGPQSSRRCITRSLLALRS